MRAETRRRLAGALAPWRLLTPLVITAAALLAGLSVAASGAGAGLDGTMQVWRDEIRARPASGRLALIEIDARSLAALDQWPWPRRYHARAIEALQRAGAETIAFDVDFSARSSLQDDAELARAIEGSTVPVILPVFRQRSSQGRGAVMENLPLEVLRGRAQLAAVNVFADADGLVRSYPYGISAGGLPRPSIGALLAGAQGRADTFFPIDGAIRPSTLPHFSFIDLLNGNVAPGALRGRGVLIGATAIEMGDRYPVPRRGVLPGAVIQLLAAETLLQGTSPVDRGPLLPLILILLLLPVALRQPGRRRATALVLLGGMVLLLPLAMEMARLGSAEIVPAGVALVAAAILSGAASALRAARRARLVDEDSGLPNRRALEEVLADRDGGTLTAVRVGSYGDVVGVMGHGNAAELLARLAERLALASDGAVYRVEDNALAWLMPPLPHEDLIGRLEGAVALIRAPVEVGGRPIELAFACGVAPVAGSGRQIVSHALLTADIALERGERLGHYDEELDRERDWRLSLAAELDKALAAGDVWVAYQPKYDINAGRITAAEALVRWRHPERGNIPPDSFIPALEESGRILDLTLCVLERSLRDMAAWQAAGLRLEVAVNISALLPADPHFSQGVDALLARHEVAPDALTFEVTESVAMANPEAAIPCLERFAAMGIRLSIDDYGTGQSTLSYLKRLPAREIKIDKSFVQALETSRSDQAMVRSTIQLAHELGFKVVAEGVETAGALQMLRSYGCDVAQGWHIGKPMPADELVSRVSGVREAA